MDRPQRVDQRQELQSKELKPQGSSRSRVQVTGEVRVLESEMKLPNLMGKSSDRVQVRGQIRVLESEFYKTKIPMPREFPKN